MFGWPIFQTHYTSGFQVNRLKFLGGRLENPAGTKDFIILGYSKEEKWEDFLIGEDYEAFLLKKKDNKLFI